MISIIIPTYNAAKTLSKTLASIFMNQFKDFEVIVVDDFSSDQTAEIVKSFPVLYERLDANRGAASARNRGAQLAKGEILLFIDADMEVKSDLLTLINEQFQTSDYDVITGSFAATPKIDNIYLLFISTLSNYNFSNADFVFSTHLAAMKKKVFQEISGFDERIKGATVEDFELYHRLILNGYKCKTDMRLEAFHYHSFTFYTFFRRMFRFGLLKTPIILRHNKNKKFKSQPKRYLVNHEYVLSYVLILLLIPSLILTIQPKFNFVILLWLISYVAIKFNYLKKLKSKRLLMFLLLIINDAVVLTGCLLGAAGYYRNRVIEVMSRKGTQGGIENQKLKQATIR